MTLSQRTKLASIARLLPLLIIVGLGGWPCSSVARSSFPEKYDGEIRSSVKQYWPDLPDWKLWKSQLWQESQLDPTVCSSVGACGLAQFMPASWSDMLRQIGADAGASRFDARLAIQAGAYYQGSLRRSWKPDGRTGYDRNDLGAASYNAGLGSVLKAQRLCDDARLWAGIAPCMDRVTGSDNGRQTRDYVAKINRWRLEME